MDIVQYNNTPRNEATAADYDGGSSSFQNGTADDGSSSLQVGESSSTDYTGLLYGECVCLIDVCIIYLFDFNITLLSNSYIYNVSCNFADVYRDAIIICTYFLRLFSCCRCYHVSTIAMMSAWSRISTMVGVAWLAEQRSFCRIIVL